mmetsp:Transcript_28416/g.75021  ORF Transcript_28416/g.75021 Transcript_28416/m.75021 type:complete len:325 (+) Transcript_28416:183-1157(+)
MRRRRCPSPQASPPASSTPRRSPGTCLFQGRRHTRHLYQNFQRDGQRPCRRSRTATIVQSQQCSPPWSSWGMSPTPKASGTPTASESTAEYPWASQARFAHQRRARSLLLEATHVLAAGRLEATPVPVPWRQADTVEMNAFCHRVLAEGRHVESGQILGLEAEKLEAPCRPHVLEVGKREAVAPDKPVARRGSPCPTPPWERIHRQERRQRDHLRSTAPGISVGTLATAACYCAAAAARPRLCTGQVLNMSGASSTSRPSQRPTSGARGKLRRRRCALHRQRWPTPSQSAETGTNRSRGEIAPVLPSRLPQDPPARCALCSEER